VLKPRRDAPPGLKTYAARICCGRDRRAAVNAFNRWSTICYPSVIGAGNRWIDPSVLPAAATPGRLGRARIFCIVPALTIRIGSLSVPYLGALRLKATLSGAICGARNNTIAPRRKPGSMVQARSINGFRVFPREQTRRLKAHGKRVMGPRPPPVLAARKVHFEIDLLGAE